jgi:hypothetical protein
MSHFTQLLRGPSNKHLSMRKRLLTLIPKNSHNTESITTMGIMRNLPLSRLNKIIISKRNQNTVVQKPNSLEIPCLKITLVVETSTNKSEGTSRLVTRIATTVVLPNKRTLPYRLLIKIKWCQCKCQCKCLCKCLCNNQCLNLSLTLNNRFSNPYLRFRLNRRVSRLFRCVWPICRLSNNWCTICWQMLIRIALITSISTKIITDYRVIIKSFMNMCSQRHKTTRYTTWNPPKGGNTKKWS